MGVSSPGSDEGLCGPRKEAWHRRASPSLCDPWQTEAPALVFSLKQEAALDCLPFALKYDSESQAGFCFGPHLKGFQS